MNDKIAEKKTIDPGRYRKIIGGLELKKIYLDSCAASINRKDFGAEAGIGISSIATYTKTENNEIDVTQKYLIEAKDRTTKKKFLSIKCEYHFIYSSVEEFSDEFFDTFKRANLPVNAWPFFRELVYNMTSRMHIPPITLPLIRR